MFEKKTKTNDEQTSSRRVNMRCVCGVSSFDGPLKTATATSAAAAEVTAAIDTTGEGTTTEMGEEEEEEEDTPTEGRGAERVAQPRKRAATPPPPAPAPAPEERMRRRDEKKKKQKKYPRVRLRRLLSVDRVVDISRHHSVLMVRRESVFVHITTCWAATRASYFSSRKSEGRGPHM